MCTRSLYVGKIAPCGTGCNGGMVEPVTQEDRPAVLRFQVTFDAYDPHALAAFWAAALHYVKEDHSAIVRQLLAAGRLRPEDTIETSVGIGFRDLAACQDPAGLRPRLYFQRPVEADQTKTSGNRVHLDIHAGSERTDLEADRLVGLGATRVLTSNDRGVYSVTLHDPEGNEFSVS